MIIIIIVIIGIPIKNNGIQPSYIVVSSTFPNNRHDVFHKKIDEEIK